MRAPSSCSSFSLRQFHDQEDHRRREGGHHSQDGQQRCGAPEHRGEQERHGATHGTQPGQYRQRVGAGEAGRFLRHELARAQRILVRALVVPRSRGGPGTIGGAAGRGAAVRLAQCLPLPGGQLNRHPGGKAQRVEVAERPRRRGAVGVRAAGVDRAGCARSLRAFRGVGAVPDVVALPDVTGIGGPGAGLRVRVPAFQPRDQVQPDGVVLVGAGIRGIGVRSSHLPCPFGSRGRRPGRLPRPATG